MGVWVCISPGKTYNEVAGVFLIFGILLASTPLQPPRGQRCSGRNYNRRRCCTPEHPCGYGEGDCDGPLDGGRNDGHRGCRGNLVCGSNNCRKFGEYYHEKDDCCDLASSITSRPSSGWNSWGAWSSCTRNYSIGRKSRVRYCRGSQCTHTQENQERLCFP